MSTSILRLISPKISLILICLLYLFTHLYQIWDIPPSVYWDEASIGYNAYSISLSGKDEWGDFLPIHFRAFGEFKLPVYIYTTAIFVKFFGLNEFSIRFPAVLFSLGSIIITYFLARKLFNGTKIALFSAFFMATSSWMFIFSRSGFEVSAGLMFYLLGIYWMLKAPKNKYMIFFGTTSFILSIYSYNSYRILAPLTLILLFLVYIRLAKEKSYLFLLGALFFFIVSLTPIVRLVIFDTGFGRVQTISIFPTIRRVYDLSGKPHLQLIFDRTKETDWGNNLMIIVNNYFTHFSPSFLLFNGDENPRLHPQGSGQLFITDIFLVLLGIFLIKGKGKLLSYLPIILMFLGPIPSILFKENPHALRSLTMVPFISILMGVSAAYLSERFMKAAFLIIIAYLLFFSICFQNFIFKYSDQASQEWQYGYKRLFIDYKDKFENFDKVIISDEFAQPYIFALYYLKYDPEKFRSEVKYNPYNDWGFSTAASFNKFEFRKIVQNDVHLKNSLIFATALQKLDNIETLAEIKFMDGRTAFKVYSTK